MVLAACAASFLSVDTAFALARPPGVGRRPVLDYTDSGHAARLALAHGLRAAARAIRQYRHLDGNRRRSTSR